jgi:4-hydroxy-tetrahydrodipicolinate synthase/2-dehydro-3-deoxy-phosphogluconate/2-dehydro-3-deoxy-6-phosphogalactonate aldolase
MPDNAPTPGTADPLNLHGVIPPLITAFDADEDVNHEATAAHARFLVEQGVHGVFPLGTNGEFPMLSPTERERIVQTVVDEVGGDVPVIAGVGAPSTRETVRHSTAAVEAGADGIVVVTPYYYPLDHERTIKHYRRVADAVDCPIYVYHIPQRTGNELAQETLRDIATIDSIVGLKDTSRNVPWLGRAIGDNTGLTFLAGANTLVYTGLDMGCAGVVSSVSNAFPELVVDLYRAYDEGDRARAKEIQRRVSDVAEAFDRGSYMAGVKTALDLRDVDFDPGPLRSPLRKMDDVDTGRLQADLTDLGLL